MEWVRTNQGDDEERNQDCDEEEFQMARVKFVREAGKLQIWGIVGINI